MRIIPFILLFIPLLGFAQNADLVARAEALYLEGDTLFHNSVHDEAILKMGEAKKLFIQLEDWDRSMDAELTILECLWRTSRFEEAFDLAAQIEANPNLKPESRQNGMLKYGLGNMNLITGNLAEAIKQYLMSVAIMEKLFEADDPVFMAVKSNYSKALTYSGNLNEALDLILELVSILEAKHGQHHPDVAEEYLALGEIYRIKGFYDEAQNYFERGLEIERELFGEEFIGLADWYGSLGLIQAKYGSFSEAANYYKASLRIQKAYFKGQMHPSYATNYANLGGVLLKKEQYDSAIYFLEKAEAIYAMQQGSINAMSVYNNLAVAYREKEDSTQALHYYGRSIEYFKANFGETPSPDLAEAYGGISLVYRDFDAFDQANDYHELAVKTFKEVFGDRHPSLAIAYREYGIALCKAGKFEASLHAFQESIQSIYDELPAVYFEKSYLNPPTENTHSALELLETMLAKALTLEMYAQETSESDLLRNALSTYQVCDTLIDEIQNMNFFMEDKLNFRSDLHDTYASITRCLLKLDTVASSADYADLAFHYAEKSKGNILRENLNDRRIRSLSNVPDSVLNNERRLKTEISFIRSSLANEDLDSVAQASQNRKLLDTNRELEILVQQIQENLGNYYQLKYGNNIKEVDQIQKDLENDELVVEYQVMGDQANMFVITSGAFQLVKLPVDYKPLIQSIRDRVSWKNGVKQLDQEAVQILYKGYEALLKPALEIAGEGISKIQIVPDGEIGYIPFEVLLTDPNAKVGDVGNWPFVLKDYVVNYQYSLGLSDQFAQTDIKAGGSVISFAPTYALDDFEVAEQQFRDVIGPLAWTKEEAQLVSGLFSGKAFLGEEATESAFKAHANEAKVLHFAMHSLIDERDPMDSRLVFTPNVDSLEDGLLYTHELYNMTLQADLAVLSACATGTGQLERGEGIMSVARGFRYAGVPSIVMSHWQVDDFSTGKIMASFYEHLATGLGKSEALRKAKLEFLSSANEIQLHPHFWGSFVLIGEDTPLNNNNNRWVWIMTAAIAIILLAFIFFRRKS